LKSYEWGEILRFSGKGNVLPYLGSGWAAPEVDLIWTDGYNARLSLGVEPAESNIAMILRCYPFISEGKVPHQELHIFVNFLRVGFHLISGSSEIELVIPERVLSGSELDIDFYLPKAASPASLKLGPDIRVLGLAVSEMALISV
jgi:hypothetical protein